MCCPVTWAEIPEQTALVITIHMASTNEWMGEEGFLLYVIVTQPLQMKEIGGNLTM